MVKKQIIQTKNHVPKKARLYAEIYAYFTEQLKRNCQQIVYSFFDGNLYKGTHIYTHTLKQNRK